MKFDVMKKTRPLNLAMAILFASATSWWIYESTKNVEIHNAQEAAELVKKRVRNKKMIPVIQLPVISSIQSLFDIEALTCKYLQDEPCAVLPYGNCTDQPNSPHYQWQVLMPYNEGSAQIYVVNNKGQIGLTHCDANLRIVAQNHSLYDRTTDKIWNLPKVDNDHAKLIEEAKRNGSKCTYY